MTYIETSNQYRAAVLSAEQEAVNAILDAWRDVERALIADIDALAESLIDQVPVPRWQIARQQRYLALLEQVEQEIASFNNVAAGIIDGSQRTASLLGIQAGSALIEAVAGSGLMFDRLPVGAVENLVALSRNGMPLQTLLADAFPAAADGILRELTRGLALGSGGRNTARRVREMVIQSGLTDGLHRVNLIVRDQNNRAHRGAMFDQWRHSGVVTGFIRITALDNRVCPACLALRGTEYSTLDAAAFEAHPQCRCSGVPIVRGVDKPVVLDGEAWLEQQTPQAQADILGIGRYAAWRDGKSLRDMVTINSSDAWGLSAVPTALKDL